LGVDPSYLDDVIQEVFLVVARKLPQVEVDRERAFVAAVTTRVSANWRRTQRRRPEELLGWVEELSVAEAPDFGPAERRQGLELLQKSLDLMTDAQREVFILAELEQLTAAEIAKQLELPEAAVVSRLRRSRKAFRRFCKQQQERAAYLGPSAVGVG
jgi:RNA polymerase sigma-70 factor (ECF subfamily)